MGEVYGDGVVVLWWNITREGLSKYRGQLNQFNGGEMEAGNNYNGIIYGRVDEDGGCRDVGSKEIFGKDRSSRGVR